MRAASTWFWEGENGEQDVPQEEMEHPANVEIKLLVAELGSHSFERELTSFFEDLRR